MKLTNLEARLITRGKKEAVFYPSSPTKAKSLGWLDPKLPAKTDVLNITEQKTEILNITQRHLCVVERCKRYVKIE